MNVGTANSDPNPNSSYFNSRGIWLTYIIVLVILHYICLSLPFLTVAKAWTLTSLLHNVIMFLILHIEKGTPFDANDQGRSRFLTAWEQIDHGEDFSSSKKFLTIVPIIVFTLASFYSRYEPYHFGINSVSLLLVLIPKMPMFYGVRLFGINRY